jgi:hypothetical protein
VKRIFWLLTLAAGIVGLYLAGGALFQDPVADRPIAVAKPRELPHQRPAQPPAVSGLQLDAVVAAPRGTPVLTEPLTGAAPEPVSKVVPVPDQDPVATPVKPASKPFLGFPVNEKRVLTFRMDDGLSGRLTERERLDQLRDWMLFTVASDSGLTTEQLNQALFDVPTVRHGYLRAVANFEYGQSRASPLGGGRVLALVPAGPEAQRKDHLARIADEYRKNTGQKPELALVFEYELSEDGASAAVTRRESVTGAELFSAAYGYHQARVEDVAGLRQFLQQAPNIVCVSRDQGDSLRLEGRQRLASPYRGIRAEDVAALWQAQDTLVRERSRFDRKWKAAEEQFQSRWQEEFEALKKKYLKRAEELDRQMGPARKPDPLLPSWKKSEIDRILEQMRKEREDPFNLFPQKDPDDLAATLMKEFAREKDELNGKMAKERERLQARYDEDARGQRFWGGVGFSLDPSWDFAALARDVEKLAPGLVEKTAGEKKPVRQDEVDAVLAGLKARDEIPLFVFLARLGELARDSAAARELVVDLEDVQHRHKFQAARYDGDLRGTEVGMVLFYTDLLAKLWAMNFAWNTPSDQIADFRAMTALPVAPIYEEEIKRLGNTRLWFGPLDKGLQLTDQRRTLFFAHAATRIFAKSRSNQTREESQANARSEAFLGWWNDHYEEVAAFEPEYERLNAIMKWSVVVSWLSEGGNSDRLGFLRGETVEHDAWFPDWCKKQPGLRFTAWKEIKFYPKGHQGTSTEAMEILVSPFDILHFDIPGLSGGVSLANPELFKTRLTLPELARPADALILRGNLDLKGLEGGATRTLRTLDGVQHTLLEPRAARGPGVESQVRDGLKLRGRYDELANGGSGGKPPRDGKGLRFDRAWEESDAGRSVSTSVRLGDRPTELGALHIERTRNGFDVDFHSRDIDKGHALAQRLSAGGDLAAGLALDPNVEFFCRLADGSFLAKQRGGDKWLKLAPEGANQVTVATGWHGRSADTKSGAKRLNLAWLDRAEVARDLGRGDWLWVELPGNIDKRVEVKVLARGPPEGKEPFTLAGGKGGGRDGSGGPPPLVGFPDADGKGLFFRFGDLPEAVKADPSQLAYRFGSEDVAGMRKALADGKAEYVPPKPPPDGPNDVVRAMREGRDHDAATLIARDPEGARRHLEWDRAEGLKRADRLLRERRPAEALEVLAESRRTHGNQPECLAREGLAELQRGRVEEAARLLNEVRPTAKPEFNRLLDEIHGVLGSGKLPARMQADLGRAARMLEFGAAKAGMGKKVPQGDLTVFPDTDGRLQLQYRLEAPVLEPQRNLEPFEQANPPLLLFGEGAEPPGDWSPGGWRKTLKGAVEGNTVDLLELHAAAPSRKVIEHVRPDVVVLEMKPSGVEPKKPATRWRPAPFSVAPSPGYVPYNFNPDDDDEKKWRIFLLQLKEHPKEREKEKRSP